jgi:serine/threonine protein kinase
MAEASRARSRESSISDAGSAESVVERSPRGRFCRFNRQLLADMPHGKRTFLAFDSDTGREVAWTVMPLAEGTNTPDISWLRSLEHPRIVKVFNAWINFQDQEVVYISERVAGCSLRQYISRLSGNLKSKIIKLWVKQILEALVYLHSLDYVHQKLSCVSVFVNAADGSVLVGDIAPMEIPASEIPFSKLADLHDLAHCVIEMATRNFGATDPEIVKDFELKKFVNNLKSHFGSAQEALLSIFFDSEISTSPRDSPSRRSSLESVPETAPTPLLVQKFRDSQNFDSVLAKEKLAADIARNLRLPSDAVKRFIL